MPNYTNLTEHDRQALLGYFANNLQDGELVHGAMAKAGRIFGVHRSTISRLWGTWKVQNGDAPILTWNVELDSKNSSRAVVYDRETLQEHVWAIPVSHQTSLCLLSANLSVPYSTVQRTLKRDVFYCHISRLKPSLSEEQKLRRVLFCLDQRDPANPNYYDPMYDRLFIDEKIFYITFL